MPESDVGRVIESNGYIYRCVLVPAWTRQRKDAEEYMQVGVSEEESEMLWAIASRCPGQRHCKTAPHKHE